MLSREPALVWFRRDLRLADNPALGAAVRRHATIVPVFIDETDGDDPWAPGAAQRVWLHGSLRALDHDLSTLGSRLIIRRGPAQAALTELVAQTSAAAVYWNRLYDPHTVDRDRGIKRALREAGRHAQSFNAGLLAEPWEIANNEGNPYRVFTPFWRRLAQQPVAEPVAAPATLPHVPCDLDSLTIEALRLRPARPWDEGIRESWEPGEAAAARRLHHFAEAGLAHYADRRDRPGVRGSSRLSPHLHFGEIGPRQIWHRVRNLGDGQAAASFLRQLGWREFAHHLLYHFPHSPEQPLDERFRSFPWAAHYQPALDAWQTGRTGVPFVDAAMRELWQTGWMHNRARMVAASWLTKNLLVPWQAGARWFWDTLVDADLANNTLGWQWVSGCGADAAPYFRIFNPVRQGQRFDPNGEYVRQWVPELAALPDSHIHSPWQAPQAVLHDAGVALGEHYPAQPYADLRDSRQRALAAFEQIKSA